MTSRKRYKITPVPINQDQSIKWQREVSAGIILYVNDRIRHNVEVIKETNSEDMQNMD